MLAFPTLGNEGEELGPPVVPFLNPFWGEGSPTKIDYRKKGYPFSSLSTGGPREGTAQVGLLLSFSLS